MRTIRRFIERIRHVFHWLPIIWRDHDFDHAYLYDILIFKLENMQKFFASEYAWTSDAEKHALELFVAVEMLKKLRVNYFEEETMEEHDEKWGNLFAWHEDIPGKDFSILHLERPLAVTQEEKELEREEFRARILNAQEVHEKLRSKAFKFIADHIETWWD